MCTFSTYIQAIPTQKHLFKTIKNKVLIWLSIYPNLEMKICLWQKWFFFSFYWKSYNCKPQLKCKERLFLLNHLLFIICGLAQPRVFYILKGNSNTNMYLYIVLKCGVIFTWQQGVSLHQSEIQYKFNSNLSFKNLSQNSKLPIFSCNHLVSLRELLVIGQKFPYST